MTRHWRSRLAALGASSAALDDATQDAALNYDGTKLAAQGAVVVTITYRLGALGFLAHPTLADRPGGAAGNRGLMDQQAALRWVRHNIGAFGGDPDNVTIAGQSAGGLSVLAHLVSPGSRGLFQRKIIRSDAFALHQVSLADAEAFGPSYAASPEAGCPSQTASCLRGSPAAALVNAFPDAAIPGVIDGKVLHESVGSALAAGRFARVPVINGVNQDEELIFVLGVGVAVGNGSFVLAPTPTPETYGAAALRGAWLPTRRDPLLGDPVPPRPAQREVRATAGPDPGGPGGEDADGLGELRREGRPGFVGRSVAVVQHEVVGPLLGFTAALVDGGFVARHHCGFSAAG